MNYDELTDEALGELVREEMDNRASAVTNDGRDSMIAFLECADTPAPEPFTVAEMQHTSHETAVAKGWWEDERDATGRLNQARVEAVIGIKCMLITSEVAEAFEEFRDGRMMVYWVVPGCGQVTASDIMNGSHTDLSALSDALGSGPLKTEASLGGFREDLLAHIEVTYKPEGFGIELADAIIRSGDLAGALTDAGILVDLEYCIKLKAAYNKTRSHRHGGKRA